MERNNIFKGVGVALVTPFLENGDIDFKALRSLVDCVLAGGVDFLCVLGTTAETPCLSIAERQLVMDAVAEVVSKRVPLLLGCGGNNTREVVSFLQTANLEAYQGVLIVTPYYNRPSQEGLFLHFERVALASSLPVVLYNVPSRTGVFFGVLYSTFGLVAVFGRCVYMRYKHIRNCRFTAYNFT